MNNVNAYYFLVLLFTYRINNSDCKLSEEISVLGYPE